MQFDGNDVMRIEVSRDGSFAMSDHYPLVTGIFPDGRRSYIFLLERKDGLAYYGTGHTPEEACFLQRGSDGKLTLANASPSDALYVYVLRYDPDAYMYCDYYEDKMRAGEVSKDLDLTEPFSWKLHRYLLAFYQAHDSPEVCSGRNFGGRRPLLTVAEEEEMSGDTHEAECGSSEDASICTDDEDWRTAKEGSIVFSDVSHHSSIAQF